jgi:hypothetical protein
VSIPQQVERADAAPEPHGNLRRFNLACPQPVQYRNVDVSPWPVLPSLQIQFRSRSLYAAHAAPQPTGNVSVKQAETAKAGELDVVNPPSHHASSDRGMMTPVQSPLRSTTAD